MGYMYRSYKFFHHRQDQLPAATLLLVVV
uniref:Uncharacterized protein n=1 Tax=Rhizophora mucronata TaxID=61149 RepID=A0A2P2MXR1_RHIMU